MEESYFCDWWSRGHWWSARLAGGKGREEAEPGMTGQQLCAGSQSPSSWSAHPTSCQPRTMQGQVATAQPRGHSLTSTLHECRSVSPVGTGVDAGFFGSVLF